MKVLFAHNSLPEYRIPWFKHMADMEDVVFLITNPSLAKKIYKVDGEEYLNDELDCIFLSKGARGICQLIKYLRNNRFEFYELPPVDSIGELIKSHIIVFWAKRNNGKIGYFWEKWEAPKKYQTKKMKIKNLLIGIAAKSVYRKADVIFSPGTKSAEYFRKNGVKENKICLVPDSSEIPLCQEEDIRKKYNVPENVTLFLYFGRIIQQKGLDVLIRAFERVNCEFGKDIFLLVAGDGSFKAECEKLSRDMGLNNVLFCGAIEPHVRLNYFKQCDVFVHSGTFFEGRTDVWGLTINEAVNCGKVIIATDAVGSAYDLVNSNNGFLVKAGDVDSLSGAMIECLRSDKMKESAILEDERLYEKYNCENMARVYIEQIRKLKKDD